MRSPAVTYLHVDEIHLGWHYCFYPLLAVLHQKTDGQTIKTEAVYNGVPLNLG